MEQIILQLVQNFVDKILKIFETKRFFGYRQADHQTPPGGKTVCSGDHCRSDPGNRQGAGERSKGTAEEGFSAAVMLSIIWIP